MLPLGHVAYTWAAVAWLQSRQSAQGIDFRAAALAALLPDLVDKPLSLTLLSDSQTSQSLGHTLLGQAILTLTAARLKREWLPYALISNSHLLADQMWKYRRTLMYPFSRQFDTWQFMGTPKAMLRAYAEIASRPAILAVEAVGVALLAWVVHRGKLYRRHSLQRLLRTGTLGSDPAPSVIQAQSQRSKEEPCE